MLLSKNTDPGQQNVIVRPCLLTDLPILRKFEQDLIDTERAFDPTLKPGATAYYDLEAMLSDTETQLIVGEQEGEIIACGYARIKTAKPFLDHDKYAYLGFMYVVPNFRGQGINGRIMQHLVAWSKERGIKEIRLEVYAANRPALIAYEKAGFYRHTLEMRLPL